MTIELKMGGILAQFNDTIPKINFTFHLFGLVNTFDNSTYGAEYNFETYNLDFISNVASGIGSLFIDDDLTGGARGTYFTSNNTNFINNSALLASCEAFWSNDRRGSRDDEIWFENVKFSNNYAENSGTAMTLHYFDVYCNNCELKNQVTDGYGGNVYAYDSILSLTNAIVSNTHTYLSGSIRLEHSVGNFEYVDFSENYAYNGHGSCFHVSPHMSRFIFVYSIILI